MKEKPAEHQLHKESWTGPLKGINPAAGSVSAPCVRRYRRTKWPLAGYWCACFWPNWPLHENTRIGRSSIGAPFSSQMRAGSRWAHVTGVKESTDVVVNVILLVTSSGMTSLAVDQWRSGEVYPWRVDWLGWNPPSSCLCISGTSDTAKYCHRLSRTSLISSGACLDIVVMADQLVTEFFYFHFWIKPSVGWWFWFP